MAVCLGYASALFWIASSLAWIWSAATKSPISKHPEGTEQAIEMFDGAADGEWLSVNGLALPTATQFFAYQKAVFFRNCVAAGLSAAGAVLAALAIALTPTAGS